MAQAIIEEGAMYHMECATRRYGEHAITELLNGADDWSVDENTVLTLVTGDEDADMYTNAFKAEDGAPYSCDICQGYLVEDTRTSEFPLARDILNLSVEARDHRVTRMLSQFAQYVRWYDSDPATIVERISDYPIFVGDTLLIDARDEVLTLARDWRDKQAAVKVIVLYRDEEGVLRDEEGNAWYEYDMRGYLDMYNDGQSECDGCGRGIVSHCFYDEFDTETRCPECVDIA